MAGFPVVIADGSTVLMVGKAPVEGGINSFLLIDGDDTVYATDRITGITDITEEDFPDLSQTTSGITAEPREYDSVQTAAIVAPSGHLKLGAVAIANSVAPVVSSDGAANTGDTLTTTLGTWTGDDVVTTRQWKSSTDAGGTAGVLSKAGQTGATYDIVAGDAGLYVFCVVTGREDTHDAETLAVKSNRIGPCTNV